MPVAPAESAFHVNRAVALPFARVERSSQVKMLFATRQNLQTNSKDALFTQAYESERRHHFQKASGTRDESKNRTQGSFVSKQPSRCALFLNA